MPKFMDPKELAKDHFCRSFDSSQSRREVDEENKRIVHYASTKSMDSYGTVILPDAFDEKRFSKNPIVPWVHDYKSLPVARSMWRRSDETGLLCGTEFFPGEFPMEVFRYYALDFIRGWSVGFDYIDFVQAGSKKDSEEWEKIKEKWGLTDEPWIIFTKVDLWEYSAVPIPSNPDALTKELRDGKVRTRAFRDLLEHNGISMMPGSVPGFDPARDQAIQPVHSGLAFLKDNVQVTGVLSAASYAPGDESAGDDEEGEQPSDEDEQQEEETPAAGAENSARPDLEAMVSELVRKLDKADDLIGQLQGMVHQRQLLAGDSEEEQQEQEEQKQEDDNVVEISEEALRSIVSDAVLGEIRRLRGKLN